MIISRCCCVPRSQVIELCSHSNYLYRMTAISAVAQLCAVVPKEHVLRRQMSNLP